MSNRYVLEFSETEMAFFRQLFNSDLPVTIRTVELVSIIKTKVLNAKAAPPPKPPPSAPAE